MAGAVGADRHLLAGETGEAEAALRVGHRGLVVGEPLQVDGAEPLGALADKLIPGREAVADSKFVINYFRLSADGRMLFGGGESYGYRFPADIAAKARGPMVEIFPELAEARIDHAWGGTLAITRSRMPHFEWIAPNILTAGGYSGHGVAMATLGGKLAAEADQLSALTAMLSE